MSASLANKEKQRKSGLWEGHLVPSYREKCLTVLCHWLQEGVEREQREGNKGHTRRRLLSHRKEFSPRLEEHAGAMESI